MIMILHDVIIIIFISIIIITIIFIAITVIIIILNHYHHLHHHYRHHHYHPLSLSSPVLSSSINIITTTIIIISSINIYIDIGGNNDIIGSRNSIDTFDEIVTIEILIDNILSTVFQYSRLERIYQQHQYNHSHISILEVFNQFTNQIFLFTNFTKNQILLYDDDNHIIKTLQLVLLHNYLKIISSSSSSSSIIIGLCKYHINIYVKNAIESLHTYIHNHHFDSSGNDSRSSSDSYDNNNNSSNNSNNGFCVENIIICQEWDAHIMYLTNVLNAGKPFMNIFKMPTGPPI